MYFGRVETDKIAKNKVGPMPWDTLYNRFINQYVPQELSFFIILISPTSQMTMTPKLRIMKMLMVLVGIISPEVGIIYYWRGQEHN